MWELDKKSELETLGKDTEDLFYSRSQKSFLVSQGGGWCQMAHNLITNQTSKLANFRGQAASGTFLPHI